MLLAKGSGSHNGFGRESYAVYRISSPEVDLGYRPRQRGKVKRMTNVQRKRLLERQRVDELLKQPMKEDSAVIEGPLEMTVACDGCGETVDADTTEYAGDPPSWGVSDETLEELGWTRNGSETFCEDCSS